MFRCFIWFLICLDAEQRPVLRCEFCQHALPAQQLQNKVAAPAAQELVHCPLRARTSDVTVVVHDHNASWDEPCIEKIKSEADRLVKVHIQMDIMKALLFDQMAS